LIPEKTDRLDSKSSKQQLLDEIERLHDQLTEYKAKASYKDEQLQASLRYLHFGYWEWDVVNNCFMSWSEQITHIFGLSLSELGERLQTSSDFYDSIHPMDLELFKQHASEKFRHNLPPNEPHIFDYRIIRSDGEIRHVRQLDFRASNDQGFVTKSFGLIQDITGQQEPVSSLQKSNESDDFIFHELPLGIQEEDYRSIKRAVDKLRYEGVENLQEYLLKHPKILFDMVSGTRITRVNERLLNIYHADTVREYLAAEAAIENWWNTEWIAFYAAEISALAGSSKIFEIERVDTRVDDSLLETRSLTRVALGSEESWERVITIHEDISERKQYEATIIEARAVAESASRAKSEFLSRMSHELRTPLNAILGFSDLFSYDKTLGEKHQSHARKINLAGEHLRSLIDEVLDLSHVESGKIKLEIVPVWVGDVLAESISWITAMARSRGVRIEFDRSQFDQLGIQADPGRLKQVFMNLLTNAIKYNKEDGCVSIICKIDKNQLLSIGFCDTGPGISEENLRELFQPFNRLGAENSAIEGTGLGLVITKQLIKGMKGHLRVDSKLRTGSTFWVEFKLIDVVKQQNADTALIDDNSESDTLFTSANRGSKILVAEDDETNRIVMAAQLGILDLKADYAENGSEALRLWETGKYTLLLTDIRMPVMDGNELIRRIRSLEAGAIPAAPIIAITASVMQTDIEDCLGAGASEVVAKPVKLDELKKVLDKWLP
jgi:signal transduction histidine kinase/CheY-like chemotaxis protein